ncbi:helix-turn-helix domain-containing protein [Chryseobacterium arthrosphaerae]|uniref:Helix-turn-helix domain-containing protein n=1 Tax=Chryseobacterium arthrosphaerae TaxID=651561 RepID=A0A3S0N1Y4_9FLAO|nr:helix-turn-helix domain-containing protein [Chryseobacterium arthrosphaerae]
MDFYRSYLEKEEMSAFDIITLNNLIFGSDHNNQKHKSYTISDIKEIMEYQFKNNLSNQDLAKHFNLSRNTVTRWRKIFLTAFLLPKIKV